MAENHSYSKLAISFAEFMNQIDDDIIKDTQGLDFKLDLIDHSLKDGIQNPLRVKSKSNQARYFAENGLSKPVAKILKNNLDSQKLADFINDLLENDDDGYSANDLCEDFFPNNDEITPSNVAESLVESYRNILRERIAQKDERPNAKKVVKEKQSQQEQETIKPFIEKRLSDALDEIFIRNPKKELADFRMVPACLKNKIKDNYSLKEKVDKMALTYYRYIESLLKIKCEENPANFEYIASYVQNLYNNLKKRNTDQEDIFNSISENFVAMTLNKSKRSTCEILTSFFIQNCEVFDVIA